MEDRKKRKEGAVTSHYPPIYIVVEERPERNSPSRYHPSVSPPDEGAEESPERKEQADTRDEIEEGADPPHYRAGEEEREVGAGPSQHPTFYTGLSHCHVAERIPGESREMSLSEGQKRKRKRKRKRQRQRQQQQNQSKSQDGNGGGPPSEQQRFAPTKSRMQSSPD